jgi:glutaconate CoA-transferase subunit A
MGVPFLPTRSSLGTSIIEKWGFAESIRESDPSLPVKKMVVLDNPFDDWGNATKVVLVPAIHPDVTLLHVQKADRQGTVRIEGLTFADIEQAKSAEHVIITCEELVETEQLRENPDQNQLPFFCVDAVVPVAYGAFPTACYRYYDYDPLYLNQYRANARNDSRYRAYLDKWVYGVSQHQELIDRIGQQRIEAIKADPRTGYAVGLDRK